MGEQSDEKSVSHLLPDKNPKAIQKKKNKKTKKKKNKTPRKQSNNKSSRRVSVSSPRSQRSRYSQSQSQIDIAEEDEKFTLIQHNDRVMEMYSWLTGSLSWTEIKKTLQKWVSQESNCPDGENYMELALDIVNLILYSGGVRVYAISDI